MEAFIDKIKKIFVYKVNNRINFTPTLIGLGVVILVLSWIFGFMSSGGTASLSSLAEMHKTSPSYFLIDLLPILLGVLGYAFTKSQQETIESLENQISEKDHVINMNARFAKKIGEGDLSANDAEINDNDILGHSLKKMRENLALTNEKEKEQNWIAKGKDIISDILRLQNDLGNLSYLTLVELIKYIDVIQGAFYIYNEDEQTLENTATYAYNRRKYLDTKFQIGEGLVGQCAYEMDVIYRREIPDDFVTITSGILGDQKPNSLLLVPLITDEKLQGVLEFASIKDDISELKIRFLKELSDIIARTIFNLKVNTRTEKLLKDAQEMTNELQENEEQLRQNAEEMRATHEELEKTNSNLQTQIREVENAQKRQHALLENASEIISIYDEEMKLKYISPSVLNIYGYTTEEMMEGKDLDRLTAKGVKEYTETFGKLVEQANSSATIQYTYMRKDGQKIYIESTGRNLLDDPAINGIIINSRDITERKRAEKEERMKSKMQSLSENSLDLILRVGTNGQFFYANPMVKTFTQIEISDIINKNLDDVAFDPAIKDFFKDAIKTVKSTNSKHEAEVTFPTHFGDRIMQVNAIPEFSDDNKELETILFVSHDITEQKLVEIEIQEKNNRTQAAEIIILFVFAGLLIVIMVILIRLIRVRKKQNQTLARLNDTQNRILSVASHDVKNSVLAQNMVLKLANEHFDSLSREELKENMVALKKGSDELKDKLYTILHWIYGELGKEANPPALFNLLQTVEEGVRPHAEELKSKNLVVVNDIAPNLQCYDKVNVFNIVFQNLLTNAIKFAKEGGEITVRAVEEDKQVWVEVVDRGVGISQQRMQELMHETVKPTKGTYGERGTGIGLFVSRQLMVKNGGQLLIESVEGEGTTIRFNIKKPKP